MKQTMWMAPLALVGLLLAGCEGKEGPAGPGGNANVQRFTLTVDSDDWDEEGSAGQSNHRWVAVVGNIAALTDSIANNGMVLVYKQDNFLGEAVYTPLPYVETQNGFQRHWEFLYAPGDIGFTVKDTDLNTPQPTQSIQYKVVLVEGNALKNDALRTMAYEDVLAYFGLER